MLTSFFLKKKLFKKKSSYGKKIIYHNRIKKLKQFHNNLKDTKNQFVWAPLEVINFNLILITNNLGAIILLKKNNTQVNSLLTNNFFLSKLFNIEVLSLPFFFLKIKTIFKTFIINNTLYSSSYNSFTTVLSKSKSKALVRLPSGKTIILLYNTCLFINNTNDIKLKAVKNVIVRGIAKNPVDHPNGGNSNVKQPFKTPWSFIAKKGK